MTTFMQVLRFINLFSAAIMAGGLVLVQIGENPSKRGFSASVFTETHVALDRNIDSYMPGVTILAALAGIVILVVHHNLSQTGFILTALGVVSTLTVAFISQFFNVPINQRIKKWSVKSPPVDFALVRDLWDSYHLRRTIAGVVALILFILAVLIG